MPGHNVEMPASERCPCLSGLTYPECCGRFHAGEPAPTAEALMRSRFTAFARGDAGYLLTTWHPSTRPATLEVDDDIRWYRLDVTDRVKGGPLDTDGVVAFEAFWRSEAERDSQVERSRFVRERGRWYYVDGD